MLKRAVIIGTGSAGKRHLSILQELLPEADIRILAHSRISSECSDSIFYDIRDALSFQPQIAIVANPTAFHLDVANQFALIGSDLLIEKPLSINLENMEVLRQAVESGTIIVQVGYNLRFSKSLAEFKNCIDSGMIGKILSVSCATGHDLRKWRPEYDYRKSTSGNQKLGGGVLLELSHELDYLSWIFGPPKSVFGSMHNSKTLEIDVEDIFVGIFQNEIDTQLNPFPIQVSLDFLRQNNTRECTAVGSLGTLKWNGITGEVQKYNLNSHAWETIFAEPEDLLNSYRLQLISFLHATRERIQPNCDLLDGMKVLATIEAIRRSFLSNKSENLNWVD